MEVLPEVDSGALEQPSSMFVEPGSNQDTEDQDPPLGENLALVDKKDESAVESLSGQKRESLDPSNETLKASVLVFDVNVASKDNHEKSENTDSIAGQDSSAAKETQAGPPVESVADSF